MHCEHFGIADLEFYISFEDSLDFYISSDEPIPWRTACDVEITSRPA
jgi:hypothetical protein